MSENLLPCPFCGGEAHISASSDGYGVECWNRSCIDMQMEEIPTEAEAIAAWNTRAEYHGYEQSAIEAWESIKKWNTRAELGSGTLTAEQVREAIFNGSSYASYDGAKYYADGISMQAIADELNTELESGTCEYKPMWNDDDLFTGEYEGMWYTGCGDALVWNADNDECCKPPAFCPYCGGAVEVVGE